MQLFRTCAFMQVKKSLCVPELLRTEKAD